MKKPGGRRNVTPELAEKICKAKKEEEEAYVSPELAEYREYLRKAKLKLDQKKKETDPLFCFIVTSFNEEIQRDLRRRELEPHLPWGTPYHRQLTLAQDEEEYVEILRDLRKLYQHDKPEYELKVLAFVRRDRLRTERLAVKGKRESINVSSPAAEEADYKNHLIRTRSGKVMKMRRK